MTRILVTPALPYANGPIHIGHLVEHVQVSTWVRAMKMAGHDVLCVCGADSHGAAIEIAALKAGKSPADYAAQVREGHVATFAKYLCEYDGGYGSTHTDENKKHAERIYAALKSKGHIARKSVEQLRDPTDGRFLADRFVKGTCPICKTPDQYGDSCESCGSTYRATELIEPKSVTTGATPVLDSSEHIFVKLGDFADALKSYLAKPGILDASLRHFLDGWFADGLKDWDVSRDGPYFGFPIPGETNKFFYVWLDAPIGYISLTERATKGDWQSWWQKPDVEIHHFIGKDILYFHTLFWPAMLMAVGDSLPRGVHVHGMLTVDGTKMSKSRGTFINADDFAEVCPPEALRYYFAAKLTAEPSDIDLSFEDFVNRVNADLVNNVVNLVSRTIPQLHKVAGGKAGAFDNEALVDEVKKRGAAVAAQYASLDFAGAVRSVVEMASLANKYMQDSAPWDVAKTDAERARRILTTALWAGKSCIALLKPVVPNIAAQIEKTLKVAPFTFANALDPLSIDVAIEPYTRLFERLDLTKVKSVVKPTDAPASGGAIPSASSGGVKSKAALASNAKSSGAQSSGAKSSDAKSSDAKSADAKSSDAQSADAKSSDAKSTSASATASSTDATGAPKSSDKNKSKSASNEPPAEIAIDDFMKIDLRAAKVLSASAVEGSDKLIAVKLDVGSLGQRDIFAGLRPHVVPEALVGRVVVVVANLAPRKMKFGVSNGMMLAAGDVPVPLFVDGARPGDRVR